MPNNLIIPCGTSQTMYFKLQALLTKQDHEELNKYISDLQAEAYPDQAWFNDPEAIKFASDFVAVLRPYWDERSQWLGEKNSPFGAEIHTLISLQERDPKPGWFPEYDQAVLLASQTGQGMFASLILKHVLVKLWGMPEANTKLEMIYGLKDRPENVDTVMEELAKRIKDNLIHTPQKEIGKPAAHNILVMSGGFKSVIPCLTVFSLIYGLEMVYMFEFSRHLQSLHPIYNYEDPESLKIWRETWNQMAKQGWAGQASSFLRVALNGRMDLDKRKLVVF
jgi:hypothetical protein